jgi:hypothetical protein
MTADPFGLGDLPAWQQEMARHVLSSERFEVQVNTGRRNGRTLAQRYAIEGAVALGGHVHLAARDGLWCITPSALGPLWEKIR